MRFSAAAWVIRNVFCRNKVTIIVYHDPQPEIFKEHMRYLSRRYNFISLNRLLQAIENATSSGIPPKAMVVTCDDGNKTNYELLDTMKTSGVRPTLYLCSHIVGTSRHFWWSGVASSSLRSIKRLPAALAAERLEREFGYYPTKDYSERQALSIGEIIEMAPYVDFGSHTKFHSILPQCEDIGCLDEIRDSREALEKILNRPVEHFAYPNGDYGEREIELVKKCGYKSARTLDVGWNDVNSDPYRLKAIGIEDDASINILCGQLTGLFAYVKYLRHGSLDGVRPRFL